jgi:hypothetical protein
LALDRRTALLDLVEIPALALSQNAPCVASTSMGALAPNIFYYRVVDMHSFPRGLNLLCILGLRLAVGINSSFLAQLGCRAVLLAWGAATRSRWLLIRSSSIVMTLFSGLGVSSDMAAPLAGLVAFSHLQFSQIRGRQPYLIVRNILYVIKGTSPGRGPKRTKNRSTGEKQ